MFTLTEEEQRSIAEKIVHDFGNGVLKEGVYLFDQIEGALGDRVRLSDILPKIVEKQVVVLFDKHPNNHIFARQVMSHLEMSDAWGVIVPSEKLHNILGFIDCDLYVTTLGGQLIFVACHEDERLDHDRTIWSPTGIRRQAL